MNPQHLLHLKILQEKILHLARASKEPSIRWGRAGKRGVVVEIELQPKRGEKDLHEEFEDYLKRSTPEVREALAAAAAEAADDGSESSSGEPPGA